jgi:hypothetical protein
MKFSCGSIGLSFHRQAQTFHRPDETSHYQNAFTIRLKTFFIGGPGGRIVVLVFSCSGRSPGCASHAQEPRRMEVSTVSVNWNRRFCSPTFKCRTISVHHERSSGDPHSQSRMMHGNIVPYACTSVDMQIKVGRSTYSMDGRRRNRRKAPV